MTKRQFAKEVLKIPRNATISAVVIVTLVLAAVYAYVEITDMRTGPGDIVGLAITVVIMLVVLEKVIEEFLTEKLLRDTKDIDKWE